MTYGKAFKRAGINIEYMDEYETYDFRGTTPKGKWFNISKAAGAYGDKFTVVIDGKMMATACIYRTAVRLIKSN